MSIAAQIELIQPMLVAKLLSEPAFDAVSVFAIREKRLDTQVNQALAGTAGRNSKGGATIEVLMPTLTAPMVNTPGPLATLQIKFLIKEQPTINLGANGTGLTAEQLAVLVVQTFQLYNFGGDIQGLYAGTPFYRPIDAGPGAPFVLIEVTMLATFLLQPIARTLEPAIILTPEMEGLLSLSVTDNQPGGGSALYYTMDGSFPGPGNPAAVLYVDTGDETLFDPTGIPIIRAAAYAANLQGSFVHTLIDPEQFNT